MRTSSLGVPAGGLDPRCVTKDTLHERWAALTGTHDVIGFYGHGCKAGDLGCFSNFFDQSSCPFLFEMPAEFCGCPLTAEDRTVECAYSEKAIMLCKAAVMGDEASYRKIAALGPGSDPAQAKQLGRKVSGFDTQKWDAVVCAVAFEVVFQKFKQSRRLKRCLLQTGEKVLAEATKNDKNWGIGIDVGDPRVQRPSKWRGTNILGWALMEARTALR